MRRIIAVHYPNLEQKLLDQTIAAFYWIRTLPAIQKKPSTSELIDWIRALMYSGIPYEDIMTKIPFAGVLLKKNEDLSSLERAKARRAQGY